jgi:SAM-dependent methyltransferase
MSECPICGNKKFKPYNGRENAQCSKCGSLERSRYLWLILKEKELLGPSIRILHIAPERCLLEKFASQYGDQYHPCDLFPEKYKNKSCEVRKLDLCHDLVKMPRKIFDLVIHNHVLEHLPCNPIAVLSELGELLRPGGTQLFSVPFRGKTTRENLSPELPIDERIKQFGQADHLRLFGTEDFPKELESKFRGEIALFVPSSSLEVEVQGANIPIADFSVVSGHSVFVSQKPL